jgi:hypothetical protein
MKIFFLFFLLILMNNAMKISNIYLKKEYAAILSVAPMLRLHDIVVVYYNDMVLTIDYTPINQSQPDVLLKLFMGKYVPAEVRIRKMATWNLTEWYSLSPISVHDINDINDIDIDLRNKITRVIDTWNYKDIDKGFLKMNLYKRNCKHFSNFVIRNFFI